MFRVQNSTPAKAPVLKENAEISQFLDNEN